MMTIEAIKEVTDSAGLGAGYALVRAMGFSEEWIGWDLDQIKKVIDSAISSGLTVIGNQNLIMNADKVPGLAEWIEEQRVTGRVLFAFEMPAPGAPLGFVTPAGFYIVEKAVKKTGVSRAPRRIWSRGGVSGITLPLYKTVSGFGKTDEYIEIPEQNGIMMHVSRSDYSFRPYEEWAVEPELLDDVQAVEVPESSVEEVVVVSDDVVVVEHSQSALLVPEMPSRPPVVHLQGDDVTVSEARKLTRDWEGNAWDRPRKGSFYNKAARDLDWHEAGLVDELEGVFVPAVFLTVEGRVVEWRVLVADPELLDDVVLAEESVEAVHSFPFPPKKVKEKKLTVTYDQVVELGAVLLGSDYWLVEEFSDDLFVFVHGLDRIVIDVVDGVLILAGSVATDYGNAPHWFLRDTQEWNWMLEWMTGH